jgi:ATP-dependent DNA helicase DinG
MTKHSYNTEDIAVVRALGSEASATQLLDAHISKTQGEDRQEQHIMVGELEEAILQEYPIFVQAGTGTGKSLAYLFALAASGQRAVIATATNQLSEQLVKKDLPSVADTLQETGQKITFAMLKGRSNYVCKARVSELKLLDDNPQEQDSLFSPEAIQTYATSSKREKEMRNLFDWINETTTGDKTEAPEGTSELAWSQVSITQNECVGRNCPFFEECFTELARKKAKASTIVVTNHALLSQDVKATYYEMQESSTGNQAGSLFGQYKLLVLDETHAFPDYLTSALSDDLDLNILAKFVKKTLVYLSSDKSLITENILSNIDLLNNELEYQYNVNTYIGELSTDVVQTISQLALQLISLEQILQEAATKASQASKTKRSTAISQLAVEALDYAELVMNAKIYDSNKVLWIEKPNNLNYLILKIAPLQVDQFFADYVSDKILIATSATLAVNNNYDSIMNTLGLPNAYSVDVGTPFDYPKQGILYIPDPNVFPVPLGKERNEHTKAVLAELASLIEAAGGRTLALFTTTQGALNAAEYLRKEFPQINIYAHQDAPADTLVRWFSEDEHSVLCATMGLWQGVNVEGSSCSLVVVDKIPFAPPDDVLTAARKQNIDEQGGNGFGEVLVANAAIQLAQASGRLIRNTTDKGVVAILDPRMSSKGYGKTILKTLPPFPKFSDPQPVKDALKRLTNGGMETVPAQKPAVKKKTSSAKTTQAYKRSTKKTSSSTQAKKTVPRRSVRRKKP